MFMLTDWMADRMIQLGWIQKLDHKNLPNVDQNLLPNLQDVRVRPGREYSVPWQSGFTGIAYNADLVPEVRNFDELLTRADLKGRITLLTEMRDTMGFMLKDVGADPAKFTDAQWDKAIAAPHRGTRSRSDPGVHRQRVHPRPRRREHRRLRGVVG